MPTENLDLRPRDIYELKRAAFAIDRHLPRDASKKSKKKLADAGLVRLHTADEFSLCGCDEYVITAAGIALAAEYGIVRPATAEQVTR